MSDTIKITVDNVRNTLNLIESAKQRIAELEQENMRLNKLAASISKDCNETALQRNAMQDERDKLRELCAVRAHALNCAKEWLEGWACADAQLKVINKALAAAAEAGIGGKV